MEKKYPLEQLAFIKGKKLEEAERDLRQKREKLEEEKKKLETLEAERDLAKEHKDDKLEQMRSALDTGERTDKIEQMRLYLKIVAEQLKQHEKKVADQLRQVKLAANEVESARQVLLKRQRDVEKLREHKGEWNIAMRTEMERDEAKEGDEMGGTRFILRKRQEEEDRS